MNYERKYFYFKEDNQIGPISLEELIQNIDSDTLIWHEGLPDWEQAKNLDELKNIFRDTVKEIIVEKPVEVIKEIIVEKPVEIIKEVIIEKNNKQDLIRDNNIHLDTEISITQESRKTGNRKSKKILYLLLTGLILVVISYFIFNNMKISEDNPIEIKIYANIKKNNKVRIGYVKADKFDTEIQNCIIQVFGDRLIKLSEKNTISRLVDECRNEQIDILIVNESEKAQLLKIFDFSNDFLVQGKSDKFYLAFPRGNDSHLKKFNNCL